jgi:hypothetical protein
MADFAIGQAFIKAHRSILRIVPLKGPCRYFAQRDGAGFISLPTLDLGDSYVPLNGVQQATFQVDNNDKEFRLFGDNGWSDSVTTGGRVRMSAQTYFMRNIEMPAGGNCPVFRGDYDEGYAQIERARYDQEYEVYVELLKEMGRANGDSGDYIYDYAGFNAAIRNYNEPNPADDMVQVSFDAMSRGRPVFGRYNAGGAPIDYGNVFSTLLSTSATTGDRRYAVVPADNASAVVVSANLTVTYTSNGSTPLAQLALGDSLGSGFRVELASSGVVIPAVVTLNTGTGVVTIDPAASLAAGTIFRLVVRDGAITQAVDASGVASPSGFRRPLQGFTTTFRTA